MKRISLMLLIPLITTLSINASKYVAVMLGPANQSVLDEVIHEHNNPEYAALKNVIKYFFGDKEKMLRALSEVGIEKISQNDFGRLLELSVENNKPDAIKLILSKKRGAEYPQISSILQSLSIAQQRNYRRSDAEEKSKNASDISNLIISLLPEQTISQMLNRAKEKNRPEMVALIEEVKNNK